MEDIASFEIVFPDGTITTLTSENLTVSIFEVDDLEDTNITVENQESVIEIIEVHDLGPQGPPGEGGDGTVLVQVVAAEDIPAYHFVTSDGSIANSNNTSESNNVVGITRDPVSTGFVANLVAGGEITNPSWNWTVNSKLFLNGTSISITPPSTGFIQLLGVARNSHTIIIRLDTPYLL